ncbi:MAG: TonB-dependent hemoglobin/transferrin/lactoferrin family receptor [Steroidobacteraceae bacterium]|nr:TonB-dependent hemoglobin/transferrin/lactoferrin family receptor [Steroidobacteraceae bacterium]MBP7012394.1 TonB-dependent hemoglobin/transferrin/lactoferrin family receptor [Steroidobacteraceae bacterium]
MLPHSRLPAPLPYVVAAILGTTAVPAMGQPVTGADDSSLETVMVYARRLTPVSRVAATVTVIDQARIEMTLATDIRELVRYEPGLNVRNDPFRFGLDTISVRGLGGNRVAVEVDGIPAAGAFAVGSYADSGRAYVDAAFVDRVEFLRGPASSLYGSDAIGGVVAMSTLTPASLLANGEGDYSARTDAGFDSASDGWRAAALAAGTMGGTQWLVGYSRREGHESDTAADVTPNPSEYANDSALLKLTSAVPGGPLTFTAEAGRIQQETDVDAFLGVGRFLNTTALAGDDEMLRYRVSLGQALTGANGAFDSADWSAYWQGTETEQDTYEVRRAVPPRTPPVQLDRTFKFDESAFGVEFTAVKSLGSGSIVHDVVYGFEATRSELDELRDGLQTDLTTGATTPTILGETFPLRDLPLSTVVEVGAFVQDEVQFDDARWTLVPALRVDYYDLTPESDRIYREDNPSNEPAGVDKVSFAPKLGATYRISDRLGVFFQYAHGFRSPPPEDVNIGLEVPLFNIRAIPNPDLRPETSDGFETGLRLAGSPVALTASVFLTEYGDFIESKVNLGVDPATGVTLFQSQNVAEARIYGAEFDARVEGSTWSPRLQGWSGRLAGSWIRGDDLTRDVPLNSIDPPRLVLGLRYDAPSTRWGSELALTAVEAQRQVDRSRADLYRTDGYATLDWLANVDITPRLRLNIGLFNLADTEYIEWSDVRGRVADDPLVPYYTRAGFNASASLRYDF